MPDPHYVTREELKEELAAAVERLAHIISQTLSEHEDRLRQHDREIETRLLTAFHGYGRGQAARLHSVEALQNDDRIRLAAIESRLLELEARLGPPPQA